VIAAGTAFYQEVVAAGHKAAFLTCEEPDRKTIAVSTVIMDRVIALWALVWFVAISGGIFWGLGRLQGDGSEQSRLIVQVAAVIVAVSLRARKSSRWIGADRHYFFSRSTTAVIRPALLVKSLGRSLPLGSKQTFIVSPFSS